MKHNHNQYFTPTWAAEMLIRRHFPNLGPDDTVVDPTCGDGRFLMAIPPHVDAYGVEIDPVAADEAVKNSGRQVIADDFLRAKLPRRPTVIIGNPPYVADTIDAIIDRCFDELDYGGRMGFLLPVYFFNYASKIVNLQRRWSISQELVPRNLFTGLSYPILFAKFMKQRQTTISGFFLYAERDALDSLKADVKKLLVGNESTANSWRDVVEMALCALGGRATLKQLYAAIEGRRLTENPWWREKVRQIAGMHFVRVAVGEYALHEHAEAQTIQFQEALI